MAGRSSSTGSGLLDPFLGAPSGQIARGKAGGNNAPKTALMIVGEMAGGGLLALPLSVADAGLAGGTALLLGCAVLSAWTGAVLAKCYDIVRSDQRIQASGEAEQDRMEKSPYIALGEAAYGALGGVVVMVCQMATLVGVSIVFLILSAQNMNELIPSVDPKPWVVIIGALVLPLTFLESPKDFWQTSLIAVLGTTFAAVAITAMCADQSIAFEAGEVDFDSFFASFGSILFAYGGHAVFPTLQVDMEDGSKFTGAIVVAYLMIIALYMPVALAGYLAFGAAVDPSGNILANLTGSVLKDFVLVCITVHMVFSVLIIQSPVSQLLDLLLKLPSGGGPRRYAVRTLQMAVNVVVAITVYDHLFCIVNVIGGTSTTMLTFIIPSAMYLALRKFNLPLKEWAPHVFVILVGVVGGVSSTKSAVDGC